VAFLSPYRQVLDDHGRFLPNPAQFIFNNASSNLTLCSLDIDSVIKSQNVIFPSTSEASQIIFSFRIMLRYFNDLQPSGYHIYHLLQHSKPLQSAHMCAYVFRVVLTLVYYE
jgi:hypothetical protein